MCIFCSHFFSIRSLLLVCFILHCFQSLPPWTPFAISLSSLQLFFLLPKNIFRCLAYTVNVSISFYWCYPLCSHFPDFFLPFSALFHLLFFICELVNCGIIARFCRIYMLLPIRFYYFCVFFLSCHGVEKVYRR